MFFSSLRRKIKEEKSKEGRISLLEQINKCISDEENFAAHIIYFHKVFSYSAGDNLFAIKPLCSCCMFLDPPEF